MNWIKTFKNRGKMLKILKLGLNKRGTERKCMRRGNKRGKSKNIMKIP